MSAGLVALALLSAFQSDRVEQLSRELSAAIGRSDTGQMDRLVTELGRIRSSESLQALAAAARQMWPNARADREPHKSQFQLTLLQMREMRSSPLIPAWLELLADRMPPLRAEAVDALRQIRDDSRVNEVDTTVYGIMRRERDPQVVQSLQTYVQTHGTRSTPAIDKLIEGLESDDQDLRFLAARALVACTLPDQQEKIEAAIADHALSEADSWAQAYAVYLMRDHSWVSEAAVLTLARAVPRTRDIDVRISLLDTLAGARTVTDELLEAVRTGLKDGRCPVIAAAAQTMRRLDIRSTMPELIDALRDAMPHLKEELCDVLRGLTGYVYRDHSGWMIWWETFGEAYLARTYEPPANPPPDVGGTVEEPGTRHIGYCPRCGAIPTFFGAPIDSLHVAFIVDRSGTMFMECPWRREERSIERHPPQIPPRPLGATKIDILKWELGYAMALMPNYSVAGILAFDRGVTPWPERGGPVVINRQQRESAVSFVNSLSPASDTNYHEVLRQALQLEGVDTIFVLGDGWPDMGEIVNREDLLAAVRSWQEAREVPLRIHTVFLGVPNEVEGIEFMRRLAAENGGRFFDCSH